MSEKIIEICCNCETENVSGESVTDGAMNNQQTDDLCEFCMHSRGAHRVRFFYNIASVVDFTESQVTATLARVHWQEVERRKDKKGDERKSKDTGVR
jgi:hypothetical protein